MSFKSKEIKGIYNKIISNDYLLGKYLLHLSYAFEAAGIVVGYNFSDYVYSWGSNRVLNILKYGLQNREEDRRPLKMGILKIVSSYIFLEKLNFMHIIMVMSSLKKLNDMRQK